MEQTIFRLIRHGETHWNRDQRLQGQVNSKLNTNGIRQAETLAKYFTSMSFHTIYSSDLGRAAETARPIAARYSIPWLQDERLRERDCGVLQGLTREQAATCHAYVYRSYESGQPDYTPPNGESRSAVLQRVMDFLNEKQRQHRGQSIAVVTHGGVIHTVVQALRQSTSTGPRSSQLVNGSITTVTTDGDEFCVGAVGQSDHLRGGHGLNNLG